MNVTIIILLILSIMVETGQQLFFKKAGKTAGKFVIYSSLGILFYLLFVIIWFRILKDVPLGFALPTMGLNYVSVAIVGQMLFDERITLKRWGGIILIVAGTTLVWIGGINYL